MKTFSSFFKTLTLILILLATSVNAHAWGWVKYESTSPTTIYPGDKVEIQMLLNGDANGANYKRFGYGTTNRKAGLTWSNNYNWIENVGSDNRWKFNFTPTSATTYYWSLWIGWGNSVGDNGRYYKTGDWNEGSGSYQSASVTVNAVPEVKAFTATAQSTSSIALSWTKNSLNDDVLIVQGSSTAPTQGTSYSNGSTIGTGKVVYKGSATSTTITGLSASTSYTFYIYSIHNSKYYSASTSASATTKTPTNSLTVEAGEGVASVTGSTVPVTLGNKNPITATPKTGYTFSKWTADPAANATFGSATTANTTVTVKNGSVTVTASATETLYAITVESSDNNHGTVTQSTDKAGIATTITITATPKDGYRFVNWTATNGITIADDESTTTTITASAAGTVTAKFEEIPSTRVYFKPIDAWKGNDVRFAVYYWEGSTNGWVNMISIDCSGNYYTAGVPEGFTNMKFVSFPTDKANNWDYDINRTEDLTVPTDMNKVLYDMASTNITHIYLQPDNNWKQGNAAFQAYFWGNTEYWEDMTSHGDGIYVCENKAQTNILFYRQDPSNGYNKWTQTEDLKVPTNGQNLFVINQNSSTDWDTKSKGTWSTIYDNSKWTGFTEPTFDVIVHITGRGSIEINGTTYKGDSRGTTNRTITGIAANATLSVGAVTPNEHWTFDNAQIKIGSNEQETLNANSTTDPLCGDAEIYVNFTTDKWEVTFNINTPKGVIYPEDWTPNLWQYVENNGTVTEPTVKEIDGYIFGGWYTNNSTFSESNAYDFATKVTDHKTLYARWARYEECVFFKNNLGWGDVYVYTFSDNAWYDDQTGVHPTVNSLENGKKMIRMGQSDIYYYVMNKISNNYTQENNANKNYIAFSNKDLSTHDQGFYDAEAVYRGDHKKNLTLFVPLIKEEQKPENENVKAEQKMKYYNKGLWMKYNSTESGYQMPGDIPNDDPDHTGWETHGNKFITETPGIYTFSITKQLEANRTYEFKIRNYVWVIDWEGNEKKQWFAYNGTITQDKCTNLDFIYEESKATQYGNTKITTTTAGEYTFHIYLGDGKVILSVDYPLSEGDYQLWYTDDTYKNDAHHTEERIIKKCNEGSRLDTISFFVRKDKNPKVKIYQCSHIQGNTKTWIPVKTLSNITVDSTSVYNFVIEQTNEGDEHAVRFTGDYFLHAGEFYIRTDAADGGWHNYRHPENRFTYSSYADKNEDFSHYFCKYVKVKNVKFNVGTDYAQTLCISLAADPQDANPQIVTDSNGDLPAGDANVRFGWDCHTNKLTRAYLPGSSDKNNFLRIIDAENLKDAEGNAATQIVFGDLQNWIYQLDVKADKSTLIKLVANYNGKMQYFKGDANDKVSLLFNTATTTYDIRLIYDFKTNHLMAAMILNGDYEVTDEEAVLGADMMVIRKDQGKAEQLTFNPNSNTLSDVGTAYAVMTFTKDHIQDNDLTERERSLYWLSFPFDVQISDVFGFGEYEEEWILQYYDGAERAEKGLFGDSGTYWKYIFDTKTVLKAGVGYVLVLDLNKIDFPNEVEDVSLYFPSTEPVTTISGELPTADTVPEHWCNIDREWTEGETTYHHKYTDSHWNLIGVPGFADIQDFNVTKYHFTQYTPDVSFYYTFNLKNSTYTVASAATNFQAMYSYMVQFAGTINWVSKTVKAAEEPQELAARRYSESELPEKVVLGLELVQGEEVADRTFVQLQQEGATANFDLSLDLTKIMNSCFSNIYTLTDSLKIQAAGNALPMEESVVPVGVNIAAAGEYTFRMPDGTEGMVVELIDYETNTRTNLLLSDYIVTLPKGTSENRFALHIQPQKDVVTSLENIGEGVNNGEAVNKYLIDGKLIIRTAEGVVFDAQGKRL